MDFEILKIKAKNNEEIALYCEKQKLYDIATSRYYYSIYQSILSYIYRFNPNYKVQPGVDSHTNTVAYFSELIIKDKKIKYNSATFETISLINKLKSNRKSADYTDNKFEVKIFKSDIQYQYKEINKLLKKLM